MTVILLRTSGGNFKAQYTIEGVQKDSGWAIYTTNLGDIIDLTFSIVSGTGQVQYSSGTTYTNFTSLVFNYQVNTFYTISGGLNTFSLPAALTTLTLTGIDNSTDTSTGTLIVNGGAAIQKNLNIGGSLFSTNITSNNIVGTTSTIPNSIFTNITTSNLRSSNIGVGTIPNSTYPLDVTGSIATRFYGSTIDSSVVRFENTSSGGRNYHVGSTGIGSGAGNGFSIYDVTSTAVRLLIGSTGNVGINNSTPAFTLDVTGTIARDGIRLPRFHNGTLAAATTATIPIYFGDSTYNYVEIKVKFSITVDAIDITFAGNTLEDGTGTALGPNEQRSNYVIYNDITHTFQGQNSNKVAVSAGNNQDCIFTFKFIRGNRYHFEYSTVYTYATIGATRLVGQGWLDPTTRSLKITPASGNISGTYSTVHSY